MNFCSHRVLVVAGFALWSALVAAAPLPGNLQITGTVSLDTVYSLAPTGGANQSGSLSLTSGGADSTWVFGGNPTSISPAPSLSGALTDTGDGIGITFSMAGAFAGGSATTDGLFGDYGLLFTNISATETYTVTLRAVATNNVSASGADAFAFSELSVKDAALVELFFTDHEADTVNAGNNFTLESASNLFDIVLAPGQSLSLSGLQSQRGGAFLDGSSYAASLAAFLSIDNVRVSGGNPNPVPLPGTLALFGAALLGLVVARRR